MKTLLFALVAVATLLVGSEVQANGRRRNVVVQRQVIVQPRFRQRQQVVVQRFVQPHHHVQQFRVQRFVQPHFQQQFIVPSHSLQFNGGCVQGLNGGCQAFFSY